MRNLSTPGLREATRRVPLNKSILTPAGAQLLKGLAIMAISAISGGQDSSDGKPGGKRRSGKSTDKKDLIDLHGDTHDGITVNSPKGEIRRQGKAIAGTLSNGRFVGTYTEDELIELEVFAAQGRKAMKAKQADSASTGQ